MGRVQTGQRERTRTHARAHSRNAKAHPRGDAHRYMGWVFGGEGLSSFARQVGGMDERNHVR